MALAPRELAEFEDIETGAIAADEQQNLGVPAGLQVSQTISAKKTGDAMLRIAVALEALAATAAAREARESAA